MSYSVHDKLTTFERYGYLSENF